MRLRPADMQAAERGRTALPSAQRLPARLCPLRQTRRDLHLPSFYHPHPHPWHTHSV